MKAYNNQSVLNHLKEGVSPRIKQKHKIEVFQTEKRSKTKGIGIEKKQSQKTMAKNQSLNKIRGVKKSPSQSQTNQIYE